MIGAGSVLEENTIVPDGEMWVGSPAKYLRQVSEDDLDFYSELFYHQDKVTKIIEEEY